MSPSGMPPASRKTRPFNWPDEIPDRYARLASIGRVVVTMDPDYPRLLALGHADSPGLILFRNGDYSENDVTERLREVLEVITDAELAVSVVVVERTRIRRRRLPM